MFEKPAIADNFHEGQVSTDNISIPFDWLFGTTLTVAALFFSVVWWVRGIKAQVDNNRSDIEQIYVRYEREHDFASSSSRELQDELRRQFRQDITQSASDICHQFELFAVEIRSEIKHLTRKIDERNEAIAKLSDNLDVTNSAVDCLETELDFLVSQLQVRLPDVHIRRRQD